MDVVIPAFQYGQFELLQGRPDLAINHFTKALEIFHHVGRNHDLTFWSDILFSRADCYLKIRQYSWAINDIKQALHDCPQELCNGVSFIILLFEPNSQVNVILYYGNNNFYTSFTSLI